MSIRIKTLKTHDGGVKGRIIKSVKALDRCQLPVSYIKEGNACFKLVPDGRKLYLTEDGYIKSVIQTGYFIEEEKFQNILQYIYESGERLKKINDKIRKEKKYWHSEETFII